MMGFGRDCSGERVGGTLAGGRTFSPEEECHSTVGVQDVEHARVLLLLACEFHALGSGAILASISRCGCPEPGL